MKVSKEFTWDMAHRLTFHDGKCKNLHGHTYKVRIECKGNPDANGIIVDFYDIKEAWKKWDDRLDHATIVYEHDVNLLKYLTDNKLKHYSIAMETTAENMALMFGRSLSGDLPISKITVWETSTCCASYENQ